MRDLYLEILESGESTFRAKDVQAIHIVEAEPNVVKVWYDSHAEPLTIIYDYRIILGDKNGNYFAYNSHLM